MDLVLEQKNVILRSADPQDPAVFTGANYQGEAKPTATMGFPNQAFIVRVNPSSAALVLENIVIDGGDTRGGVLHTFQPASVGQLPTPFTLRDCTIRNCVIGAKGLDTGGITLCGCTVENCQLGLQNSHAFNTLFTGNTIGCLGRCTVRFSDFVSNAHDVAYANNGDGGWVASGSP